MGESVRETAVVVAGLPTPTDMSEVYAALEAGDVAPESIRAVVGKTAGSGHAVDYGRELTEQSLIRALARMSNRTEEDVVRDVPIILSGGTFGLMAPHVTIISRAEVKGARATGALSVGTAVSGPVAASEIGRAAQAHVVAEAVSAAVKDAAIKDIGQVHCVLVKGPALSDEALREAVSLGEPIVARESLEVMYYSNDASALGVALALKEIKSADLTDGAIRRDWGLYSSVAMTSCAAEKVRAEVVVLGHSPEAAGDLRIGHGAIRDLLDVEGVFEALRSAGLRFEGHPSSDQLSEVVQIFAKIELPPDGRVRGLRTSLLQEGEDASAWVKGVGGVLVASAVGKTDCYISGGEPRTHQGPPGATPIAAVICRKERD